MSNDLLYHLTILNVELVYVYALQCDLFCNICFIFLIKFEYDKIVSS